jgi:hypothetical protein
LWAFIEKTWNWIKIAFDVRDDFRNTGKIFELPPNMQALPPDKKQRMTLCNLFANHGQSIEELAVYLAMERSRVVTVLMQEGLLEDQRRRAGTRIKRGRRKSDRAISQAEGETLQGEEQKNAVPAKAKVKPDDAHSDE